MDPKESSPAAPRLKVESKQGAEELIHRSTSPSDSTGSSKSPSKLPPRTKTVPVDLSGVFHTFTAAETKRLLRRFRKLDSDCSGSVSFKEFLEVPEIKGNILAKRILETFDTNKNGEVDFQEFVRGMSQFCSDDVEVRLRFAFRIYDLDRNGFITKGELFKVTKMLVGHNLTDIQVQAIVEHTFMLGDADRDGRISFEEFLSLVKNKGLTSSEVVLKRI